MDMIAALLAVVLVELNLLLGVVEGGAPTKEPELNVRLVGGFNKYEGRVEVYWNGTWGTICDDRWDRLDAWVICKQLGFGSPLQISSTAHFGTGPGPIMLDNLDCTGFELNILNCSHSGIGVHDCTHFEDAGVACSRPLLCASNPCRHGICVDSAETFHCICHPGYKGTLCNEVVDCTLPPTPPQGAHFVSPKSRYAYNDLVTVLCNDGPSSTSWTCNEHGGWNLHQLPCDALSSAYTSTAVHSYTVIGIGSALVVIGIAVFIFMIIFFRSVLRRARWAHLNILFCHSEMSRMKRRQPVMDPRVVCPSLYVPMTGGNSPIPSPCRSNSTVSTEPLLASKSSRAHMALPPTPSQLTQCTSPSNNHLSASTPTNVACTDRDRHQMDELVSSPRAAAALQPVAPARAKKPSNAPKLAHFKFPPPPLLPTTPAPPSGLHAILSRANGRLTLQNKRKLWSQNESISEDSTSPESYIDMQGNVRGGSHYNDEHDNIGGCIENHSK
ncbi:uncharacterized protein [Diadema antillarum]|uniref:uncharacterized protein n=1 Tax=Diadema antillarum TaxID=105358 RepID=UPI003A891810